MQIVPAIDLKQGRCVRLLKGRRDEETRYSDDPLGMARHWQQAGAPRLHLVDLDGAFEQPSENRSIIRDILRTRSIPCQVGGGLRSTDAVETLLEAGARAAVLGTAGIRDPDWLGQCVDRFGADRIIAGVDCREGTVMVRGWEDASGRDRDDWIRTLESIGIRTVIYTDVERDGTQEGPDVEGTREVVESSSLRVMAAGGIGDLEHLRPFAEWNHPRLAGVIVGRALYEGAFTYGEALDLLEEYDAGEPAADAEREG